MREYFENLYKKDMISFIKELEERIIKNEKSFIVTANPETLMIGEERPEFGRILKEEDTIITADGIGVVKGASMLGYSVEGRVTGVEIVENAFRILNEQKMSLYLLGAKAEVLEKLVSKIKKEYPDLVLAGYENGYTPDKDAAFDKIVELEPDVVLVALGVPAQELLIAKHYHRFSKGIFIGVGGSFDVISGMKKRAPKIFIDLNLEWLYRITTEPSRLKRFYNSNIKFIAKVREMRKN